MILFLILSIVKVTTIVKQVSFALYVKNMSSPEWETLHTIVQREIIVWI